MEANKHAPFLFKWAYDVSDSMNMIDLIDHVAKIGIEEIIIVAKDRGHGTLELMLVVMCEYGV